MENNSCNWCNEKPKLLIDEAGWELVVYKDDEGYPWIEMSTGTGFASGAISYCPICGRKLD